MAELETKSGSGDVVEILAPELPESVADGSLAKWHKQVGDAVRRDELLAEVETDKVMLEITAPVDGRLSEILVPEGELMVGCQLLARLTAAEADTVPPAAELGSQRTAQPAAESTPPAESPAATATDQRISPAARRLIEERALNPAAITASGRGGRLLKEDVLRHIEALAATATGTATAAAKPATTAMSPPTLSSSQRPASGAEGRSEKRVKMSRLRARIAERLLQVQQNTATLTTFNDVDMGAVLALRREHGKAFESHHGVRLGLMSFFVRAAVAALARFPEINASIDGDDIVYHNYFDIGVAIATERGLVVPVMRAAESLDSADIERWITTAAERARTGKLSIEELTGGTFTITNGGAFGSLLSTPLLNPPQTAILGMHRIEERAVVRDGQIVVRSMMYLALSYDHRLVDGREALGFLKAICQRVEQPGLAVLGL